MDIPKHAKDKIAESRKHGVVCTDFDTRKEGAEFVDELLKTELAFDLSMNALTNGQTVIYLEVIG